MNTLVCDATKSGQTISMIANALNVKAQITPLIIQIRRGSYDVASNL